MSASTTCSADRAQLTTRIGAADEPFVRRLYGLTSGAAPAPYRPARLVVDAHVPMSRAGLGLARAARDAGVPFLIDPETTYLQDVQHANAPWCAVPYAQTAACTPADLASPGVQAALVKEVIDYQIDRGATAVILPYVHIDRPTSGWIQVQAGLWRRAHTYVRQGGVNVPVIAVMALGWRCVRSARSAPAFHQMREALHLASPAEVALAASRVHMGVTSSDRIAELLMLVRDLSRSYTVTLWQQGILGEAGVIEGARGYECGIGWRETCDPQSRMSQHRSPASGHPPARSVYIHQIGRSVPKRRLELARTRRRLWSRLVCPFPDCCAPAGEDLLGDARKHSVVARARDLAEIDATSATRWRWNRLTQRLDDGIELADRINALGPSSSALPSIDVASMRALRRVANARRSRPGIVRRTA